MAKNTKQDILLKAKELFNYKGYNKVSMRDIADSLNISVGNLTYHFKKKEDIAEQLVISYYTNYEAFSIPTNFKELDEFFILMEKHHEDNAYYYRHYRQLGRLSERIHNKQIELQTSLYEAFHECFQILQDKELIIHEQHENQYDSLIQMIMANDLFGPPYTGGFVNEDLKSMYWDVLHLLFSEKGKQEYLLTFQKQ